MNKQKLLLSAIGVSAVVIPAVLLIVLTARTKSQPQVPTTNRSIDARNVEETAKKFVPVVPSPSPVVNSPTPQPSPQQGTPSAQ